MIEVYLTPFDHLYKLLKSETFIDDNNIKMVMEIITILNRQSLGIINRRLARDKIARIVVEILDNVR